MARLRYTKREQQRHDASRALFDAIQADRLAVRLDHARRGLLLPDTTRPRSSSPRAHIPDPARERHTLCGIDYDVGCGHTEPIGPDALPLCGSCRLVRDRLTRKAHA